MATIEAAIMNSEAETKSLENGGRKYNWFIELDGGIPPYDVVVKDENGTYLDTSFNVNERKIEGTFIGRDGIEKLIIEVIDDNNDEVNQITFPTT